MMSNWHGVTTGNVQSGTAASDLHAKCRAENEKLDALVKLQTLRGDTFHEALLKQSAENDRLQRTNAEADAENQRHRDNTVWAADRIKALDAENERLKGQDGVWRAMNIGWQKRQDAIANNVERAINILIPLLVKAQEADSPDEEPLGGVLDVLTGWFGQSGIPLRRLDELEAENERLQAELTEAGVALAQSGAYIERTRAENERLRVFLKHLKGMAQDEDNVKLMDKIDAVLGRDKEC